MSKIYEIWFIIKWRLRPQIVYAHESNAYLHRFRYDMTDNLQRLFWFAFFLITLQIHIQKKNRTMLYDSLFVDYNF
jgi:hypothetical protein